MATEAAGGQFIGGRWTGGSAEAVSWNPARPDEEVGRYAVASVEDVDAAVQAAVGAAPAWGGLTIGERGAMLRRVAELLAADTERLALLLTHEEGKPLAESRAELKRAVDTLDYQGAQAWAPQGETFASSSPDEELRTVRVPVGVVAAITPWNFPALIPIWKIAPALLYGNAVVWKPATPTSLIAVEVTKLFEAAGVTAGALNLVLAPGAVGARLVSNPQVDAVTFTGSTAVGKRLWQEVTGRGARAQAELGGHNPAIVFDDADLDLAAEHIVNGAMFSAGQRCTATRRVVVDSQVHDELLGKVVERVRGLRVGDGVDPDVDIGPLISAAALADVCEGIEKAVADGATVVAGGESHGPGHFIQPTVLEGVTPDVWFAQEELFGPVCGVISVDGEDEAIRVANATRYGLSAAAYTGSERRIRRVIREVNAGSVHINRPSTGSEVQVPFTGMGDSGSFAPAEQGLAVREFLTRTKTAFIRPGN
jgi:acyl-CoA reductase-like NAD-dependent aldehyde dehydrogenase